MNCDKMIWTGGNNSGNGRRLAMGCAKIAIDMRVALGGMMAMGASRDSTPEIRRRETSCLTNEYGD